MLENVPLGVFVKNIVVFGDVCMDLCMLELKSKKAYSHVCPTCNNNL